MNKLKLATGLRNFFMDSSLFFALAIAAMVSFTVFNMFGTRSIHPYYLSASSFVFAKANHMNMSKRYDQDVSNMDLVKFEE